MKSLCISRRHHLTRQTICGFGFSWFFWADQRIQPLILADRRIYIPLFTPLLEILNPNKSVDPLFKPCMTFLFIWVGVATEKGAVSITIEYQVFMKESNVNISLTWKRETLHKIFSFNCFLLGCGHRSQLSRGKYLLSRNNTDFENMNRILHSVILISLASGEGNLSIDLNFFTIRCYKFVFRGKRWMHWPKHEV